MKKKKRIPNCKICKWIHTGITGKDEYHECGAQGYKLTLEVYNKKLCKLLYAPSLQGENNG